MFAETTLVQENGCKANEVNKPYSCVSRKTVVLLQEHEVNYCPDGFVQHGDSCLSKTITLGADTKKVTEEVRLGRSDSFAPVFFCSCSIIYAIGKVFFV